MPILHVLGNLKKVLDSAAWISASPDPLGDDLAVCTDPCAEFDKVARVGALVDAGGRRNDGCNVINDPV
jgi:hypothetical protein